jgi:hypothetical protein
MGVIACVCENETAKTLKTGHLRKVYPTKISCYLIEIFTVSCSIMQCDVRAIFIETGCVFRGLANSTPM